MSLELEDGGTLERSWLIGPDLVERELTSPLWDHSMKGLI